MSSAEVTIRVVIRLAMVFGYRSNGTVIYFRNNASKNLGSTAVEFQVRSAYSCTPLAGEGQGGG